jgi:hypothetical protein
MLFAGTRADGCSSCRHRLPQGLEDFGPLCLQSGSVSRRLAPKVAYLDEVKRHHIVNYTLYMRDVKHNGERTQYNRVGKLDTFMRFHLSKLPLKESSHGLPQKQKKVARCDLI